MKRAHRRGAALNERFYFRKVIQGERALRFSALPSPSSLTHTSPPSFHPDNEGQSAPEDTQNYYTEMSINQIINGNVLDLLLGLSTANE